MLLCERIAIRSRFTTWENRCEDTQNFLRICQTPSKQGRRRIEQKKAGVQTTARLCRSSAECCLPACREHMLIVGTHTRHCFRDQCTKWFENDGHAGLSRLVWSYVYFSKWDTDVKRMRRRSLLPEMHSALSPWRFSVIQVISLLKCLVTKRLDFLSCSKTFRLIKVYKFRWFSFKILRIEPKK